MRIQNNMFYFRSTRKPDFSTLKNFNYDTYWQGFGGKLREKFRPREYIFMDWIKEGSTVLDLACGNSPLLLELKNKKKCLVEGYDISSEILKEQERAGIKTEAHDISSKEFRLSKNFDYIIASETIEHIAYPEILLDNIRNNAGYFIVSFPNSAFYRYRLSLLLSGRFFTQWAYHPAEHLRYWSHIDFLDWLEALDFELVKCEASNGLDLGPLKPFKLWPNLFGHQMCYLFKSKKSQP